MAESVANGSGRWVAVSLSLAAAVWLVYAGATHERAFHDGASDQPDKWQRAAEMEPANAENWYRLGRYRHLDFDHADLPQAIAYYQHAVQLDPHSPYYKLDLAGALELAGRNEEADQNYRAAQQQYPISAEVSWRYGNFLLRQQRLPEAYEELYRALAVNPMLIDSVISRVWRSDPDVDALVKQVLQNKPDWDWDALSFFVDGSNGPAALKTWSYLVAQKAPPRWMQVNALITLLLSQAFFDDAGEVWRQALAVSGTPLPQQESLVFDGGFERDLSNGGFGWRADEIPGSTFDFDTTEPHTGTRSARITFDGTQNLSYDNLYQDVLVQPNTRYHFSGFLRTEEISTNQGVRFEIRDIYKPGVDVLTPSETGTISWTLEQTDVTSGPETRVLRIMVRRLASERFDNKISGTVWVDDVALVPAGSAK